MMRNRDSSTALPKSSKNLHICVHMDNKVLKIWKLQLGRCRVIMESRRIVQFLPSLATETDNRVKITRAGRCCTLHGLEGRVALHVFRNPVSTTERLLRGQLLNLDCFLKQWCFIRGVVTKGRVELASSQLRIILLAVHLALSPCGSGSFEVDEQGDACQCWGQGGGESG